MTTMPPPIKERDFQAQVIDLARLNGWLVHAERPARTKGGWATPIQGDAGFPDIVLARGEHLLFVELKVGRGRLTAAQLTWLDALLDVGAHVRIWRPDYWDQIVAELSRRP